MPAPHMGLFKDLTGNTKHVKYRRNIIFSPNINMPAPQSLVGIFKENKKIFNHSISQCFCKPENSLEMATKSNLTLLMSTCQILTWDYSRL